MHSNFLTAMEPRFALPKPKTSSRPAANDLTSAQVWNLLPADSLMLAAPDASGSDTASSHAGSGAPSQAWLVLPANAASSLQSSTEFPPQPPSLTRVHDPPSTSGPSALQDATVASPEPVLGTGSETDLATFERGETLWYHAVREVPDNGGDDACDLETGIVVSGRQEQSGSVASSPRGDSEASSELGYSPSCGSLDAAQQDDSRDAQPTTPQLCKGNLSEAINHAFLQSCKLSSIKLPWETQFMTPVFGEATDSVLAAPSLAALPPQPVGSQDFQSQMASVGDVVRFDSCVYLLSHCADFDFHEKRAKLSVVAVRKLVVVLERVAGDAAFDDIEACVGTRSPNTVIKRANALLDFLRWCDLAQPGVPVPFQETLVWQRVQELRKSKKAPSKANALLSAIRFMHHVLGHNMGAILESRRVLGLAAQCASEAPWVRQAKHLTVSQVREVHRLLESCSDKFTRAACAYILIALYGRCRHSDLCCIHDVLRDFEGCRGFLQIRTGVHKTASVSRRRSQLLCILVPAQGVVPQPWLQKACEALEGVGIPCSGVVDGPFFRPPSNDACTGLLNRPVSSQEVGMLMRHILDIPQDVCDPARVTSHSLKCTCLTWVSKANFDRDTCAVLGRHARSTNSSEAIYSRDLSGPPTSQLAGLLRAIAAGEFNPEAPYREFWSNKGQDRQQEVKQEHEAEVVDIASDSSDSSSDSDESSDDGEQAEQEPVAKMIKLAPRPHRVSARDDVWVIHVKSRLLHLVRGQTQVAADRQVLQCGRRRSSNFVPARDQDLDCQECQTCRRHM